MPHSPKQRLLARLNSARNDLNEAVQRISVDDLDWAPAAGMKSIRMLLSEILQTECELLAELQSGSAAEVGASPSSNASALDGLKEGLAQVRGETLAYINGLSEHELEAPSKIPATWHEAAGLEGAPVAEILYGLAMHESYHTGQLVSYMWAKGDDPYAW